MRSCRPPSAQWPATRHPVQSKATQAAKGTKSQLPNRNRKYEVLDQVRGALQRQQPSGCGQQQQRNTPEELIKLRSLAKVHLGGACPCCISTLPLASQAATYGEPASPPWQLLLFLPALLPLAYFLARGLASYNPYDNKARPEEVAALAKRKSDLFKELREGEFRDILDLGVGFGPNFEYYATPEKRIVGLDPKPDELTLKRLKKNLRDNGQGAQFKFVPGYGESMPLPDSSVDAVVCVYVLCQLSDQLEVLAEIRRILRPGGKLFLLEHVAAKEGSQLWYTQKLYNPIYHVLTGCFLERNTKQSLQRAGFQIDWMDEYDDPQFMRTAAYVAPTICGVAQLG